MNNVSGNVNFSTIMYIIGFIGQGAFFSRFLVQWIVSEFKRESVVPYIFWYLSLIGGALLLSYAVFRKDPVFILGQSFGFIVYIRNIYLIKSKNKKVLSKETK
ncbi:lipid-A-disaccharide synthase N-terminal domain-containing protein [bacterium]|nr:lipid-A-disaccharide synthase N-terminal domain-containing protein [bacterium]